MKVGTSGADEVAPYASYIIGVALFALMDAVMKGLSLGIGTYNAVLWRLLAAAVLSGAIYIRPGVKIARGLVLNMHLARAANTAAMAIAFFWALVHLPLAEAIALSFLGPLLAIYLARILLREDVRAEAYAGGLVGFGGVLVLVLSRAQDPAGSADLLSVAAMIGAAFLWACNMVLLRRQATVCSPQEIAFYNNMLVPICLAPAAPWFGLLPAAALWPEIILAAGLGVASFLLLAWANSRKEAHRLASLEYTALLWAALLGWMVFKEPFKLTTAAGSALIVAGCAFASRKRPAAVADRTAKGVATATVLDR